MKTNEQKILETEISVSVGGARITLADAPKSLKTQIDHAKGYYQGFCEAKGWDTDLDFVVEFLN